ncbi:MAG: hypothetical protein LW854_06315 [Rubrivivax sp.]|jgi:hypothetical protein|nr:hypothetical protein [Rubrivivax sp.]
MRRWIRLSALLLSLGLGACANTGALKDFAESTRAMGETVGTELQQAARLCDAPAELRALLDEARPPAAPAQAAGPALQAACARLDKASTALQRQTVGTLNHYARVLDTLADPKAMDVRSGIETTGRKIAALPAPDGGTLVNQAQTLALTRLTALLGELLVRPRRDQALEQLLAVEDSLVTVGQALRGYFVQPDGTPSAYQLVVQTSRQLRTNVLTDLDTFATAEPLRTAELRRSLPERPYAERDARTGGPVAAQMAALIDRWLALVPRLRQDARRPNTEALLIELDTFRRQARDTHEALKSSGF